MAAPRVDLPLAMAVAGFGVVEMFRGYRDLVPGIDTLRNTAPNDPVMTQHLRDANVMLGGLALIAGATASILSRSYVPLAVAGIGFIWVAGYHAVLASAPPVGG